MKKRNLKILGTIIAFLLCFPMHFVYDKFPNWLTSIFFSVNESIWEHMKMLYTSFLLTGFINYIFFNKQNAAISTLISSILSIVIYLILFLPFESNNKILIFSILIIDIIVCEFIRILIINKEYHKKFNKLSFIMLILIYIIFGYLTYKPMHTDLFKDKNKNLYGINTYVI